MKEIFKKHKNLITAGIVILIAILLVLIPVIVEKAKNNSVNKASILSGTAERGTISQTLSGTGTLSAEEAEEISIPDGIEITKYLVSNSDIVKSGDPLASVDRNSVIASMYSVWETLSEIESDMADVYYDEASTNLTDKTGLTTTGEYEVLANKHREYEELSGKLAQMYVDGYIKAPCDGMVSGIDEDAAAKLMSSVGCNEFTVTLLGVNQLYCVVQTAEDSDISGIMQAFMGSSNTGTTTSINETVLYKFITVASATPTITFEPLLIQTKGGLEYLISSEQLAASLSDLSKVEGYKGRVSSGDQIGIIITPTYDSKDAPTKIDKVEITPAFYVSSGKEQSGGMGGFGGMSTTTTEEELYSLEQTTIMSVTPMDEMTITITVDELDVLSVNLGDEATVTIDAIPGTSYSGTVTSIDTTASNNGGNTKYTAEISIERDDKMLDGMNASSLIIINEKENVLMVPVKALVENNGNTILYLGYDEKNETLINPVEVITGVSDGENVEIISGLEEGQTFYYEYLDQYESEFTSSKNSNGFSFGGMTGGNGGPPNRGSFGSV